MSMPKGWGRCVALLLVAALACGCSTFRGAPKPLLDRKAINGDTFVNAETELTTLTTTQNAAQRNAATHKLMALADLRYMQFRNEIIANRKNSLALSNGLQLMTDIAATLTDAVGVKDNYIALSALLNGGETIYNKDYLFDRTIEALVAQMDANRKAKQVQIYRSLGQSIGQYPAHAALADVLDYYYAGTLNAAVIGVHQSAVEQQKKSEQALKILTLPEIQQLGSETDRIADFVDRLSNDSDLVKLNGFLAGQGVDMSGFAAASTLKQKQTALKFGFVSLRDEKPEFQNFQFLTAALSSLGFDLN
jgi:hypothetical protein